MPESKQRDWWDKLQILLDPLGKLFTAVLVVYLGYMGNSFLQEDQKRRAYVELLSRREEADGNLRKDMFGKVIDQFVAQDKKKGALENRILNLELLAYNFHESIDLGPLLKQVYEQSWSEDTASSNRKRLQKLAMEIVGREMVALAEAGCKKEGQVEFSKLERDLVIDKFIDFKCAERNGLPEKHFWADVMTNPGVSDLRKQTQVDVVLYAQSLENGQPARNKNGQEDQPEEFDLTVSPFDFPLIDNVRLGDGGRVSLAMTRVDDGGVTLTLVYFPDSRASLRDKPFSDEVQKELDKTSTRH
jgi:hypothetical protein